MTPWRIHYAKQWCVVFAAGWAFACSPRVTARSSPDAERSTIAQGSHPPEHGETRMDGGIEPRARVGSAQAPKKQPVGSTAAESLRERPGAAPPTPSRNRNGALTWGALRLDSRPITHLAAGKQRVAAIVLESDGSRQLHVWTLTDKADAQGFALRATTRLPPDLEAAPASFQLFMGRDDWPRVLTVPRSGSGSTYLRYRPHLGWQSPKDEQGALETEGKTRGFYGTLGYADPEVLCVPGYACYEKSLRGWRKRAAPGPGIWRTALVASSTGPDALLAWAWQDDGASLLRLGAPPTSWLAPLASPGGKLIDLVASGDQLLALTDTALMARALTPNTDPSAPAFDTGDWEMRTAVSGGRGLMKTTHALLVATAGGLFALPDAAAYAALFPVQWVVPGSDAAPSGDVCCLQATFSPSTRYLVAGTSGLYLILDWGSES